MGDRSPVRNGDANTVMEPGHVHTIKPGLYTDPAGYRHSDTVLVTDSGTESLTHFPRDPESNILE